METITISVVKYCQYHKIEPQFLIDLYQNDLVNLHKKDQEYFIDEDELSKAERYIEFHYNLGINIEGIEVIHNLLSQIKNLQKKLK